MICERIDGGGVTIIACSRGRRGKSCKFCGANAGMLCDFPLRGRKAGKTCDAPMCSRCAERQPVASIDGDTVDFCPPHARAQKGNR